MVEINELRKENKKLEVLLSKTKSLGESNFHNIEGLNEKILIEIQYRTSPDYNSTVSNDKPPFTIKVTWKEIFEKISPYLVKEPTEFEISIMLPNFLTDDKDFPIKKENVLAIDELKEDDIIRIRTQLLAFDLIQTKTVKKIGTGHSGMFGNDVIWKLTNKGRLLMLDLNSISSKK